MYDTSDISQDPYCIIEFGGQKFQTQVISGGGKTPRWIDTFNFNASSGNINVEVWDSDLGPDDKIGEGNYQLSNLTTGQMRGNQGFGGQQQGGWGGQQGGQQGGWGGQQGGQQGGWGGQQGGQQGGWGGQQGGQHGGQQGWGQQGGRGGW